ARWGDRRPPRSCRRRCCGKTSGRSRRPEPPTARRPCWSWSQLLNHSVDHVEGLPRRERLSLYGSEGVHILADDAVALVDGEAGLPVDVDGLGIVLVGPLDDDEGSPERGVRVRSEGHHLDDYVTLTGGPGDVAQLVAQHLRAADLLADRRLRQDGGETHPVGEPLLAAHP